MSGINKINRCGTCHFGLILSGDLSKRLCHGAPPSAMQMPAGGGRMTIQSARPVVSVTDAACALYRGKDAVDHERDDAVISQLSLPIDQVATKQ